MFFVTILMFICTAAFASGSIMSEVNFDATVIEEPTEPITSIDLIERNSAPIEKELTAKNEDEHSLTESSFFENRDGSEHQKNDAKRQNQNFERWQA